jgi:hypothetical protein
VRNNKFTGTGSGTAIHVNPYSYFSIENNTITGYEKGIYAVDYSPYSPGGAKDDFKITGTTIKTTSKIQDNSILFNVKYPLTIIKENITYQVSSFEETLDSRFPTLYLSASEIMQKQLNHTKSICLTCLNDIANKNDFYIEINYPDKQTVVFIILDNKTIINNKTLIYEFAYDLK